MLLPANRAQADQEADSKHPVDAQHTKHLQQQQTPNSRSRCEGRPRHASPHTQHTHRPHELRRHTRASAASSHPFHIRHILSSMLPYQGTPESCNNVTYPLRKLMQTEIVSPFSLTHIARYTLVRAIPIWYPKLVENTEKNPSHSTHSHPPDFGRFV